MHKIAILGILATVTMACQAQAQSCNPRFPATCIGQPSAGYVAPFVGYGSSSIQQQENELRQLQMERQQAQQRDLEQQRSVLEQMRLNDQRAEQERRDIQNEEMRRQFERQQAETVRRSGY